MYGHHHPTDSTNQAVVDSGSSSFTLSDSEYTEIQEQAATLRQQALEHNQAHMEGDQIVFTDLPMFEAYSALNQQNEQEQAECDEEHARDAAWVDNAIVQQAGIDGTAGCDKVILAGTAYEQYAVEAIKDQALNGQSLDAATRLRLVDTLLKYNPSSAQFTTAERARLLEIHHELGGDDEYINTPPQGAEDEWNRLVKQTEYRIAESQMPEHGNVDFRLNDQDVFDADGHQIYDYSNGFVTGGTLCIPSLNGLDTEAYIQPSHPVPDCVRPEDLASASYQPPPRPPEQHTPDQPQQPEEPGEEEPGEEEPGEEEPGEEEPGEEEPGEEEPGEEEPGEEEPGEEEPGEEEPGEEEPGEEEPGEEEPGEEPCDPPPCNPQPCVTE